MWDIHAMHSRHKVNVYIITVLNAFHTICKIKIRKKGQQTQQKSESTKWWNGGKEKTGKKP